MARKQDEIISFLEYVQSELGRINGRINELTCFGANLVAAEQPWNVGVWPEATDPYQQSLLPRLRVRLSAHTPGREPAISQNFEQKVKHCSQP
jgi:hypothetical protein